MSKLAEIRKHLRHEEENRVVAGDGGPFFQIIGNMITKQSSEISNEVQEFLSHHETEFISILSLVDAETPTAKENEPHTKVLERSKDYFVEVKSHCSDEHFEMHQQLFIFATSSYLNVPIYILTENEARGLAWQYYPSLFPTLREPEQQLPYLTLSLVDKTFFAVESTDRTQSGPKATGLIGMVLEMVTGCDVPEELMSECRAGRFKRHIPLVTEKITNKVISKLTSYLEKEGLHVPGERHRKLKEQVVETCLTHPVFFEKMYIVLIRNGSWEMIQPVLGDKYSGTAKTQALAQAQLFDLIVHIENDLVRRVPTTLVNQLREADLKLTGRRKISNKVVIGSSVGGLVGGIIGIVGLALIPVTFGASVVLSLTGAGIGLASGSAGGVARAVEAVQQNKCVKPVREQIEKEINEDIALIKMLEQLQRLCNICKLNGGNGNVNSPGISLRGFMAIGSFLRSSSHAAFSVVLVAARISTTAVTAVSAVLAPVSVVLDGAFLAEALHNAVKKDNKTNAGKMLEEIALHFEMKHMIFHSMLRGNTELNKRLYNREL